MLSALLLLLLLMMMMSHANPLFGVKICLILLYI
jgi:hypothetical protein